jgi:hypothetical protein
MIERYREIEISRVDIYIDRGGTREREEETKR